jgi:predicted transporter
MQHGGHLVAAAFVSGVLVMAFVDSRLSVRERRTRRTLGRVALVVTIVFGLGALGVWTLTWPLVHGALPFDGALRAAWAAACLALAVPLALRLRSTDAERMSARLALVLASLFLLPTVGAYTVVNWLSGLWSPIVARLGP